MFWAALAGFISATLMNWARDLVPRIIPGTVAPAKSATYGQFKNGTSLWEWIQTRDARQISKSFWLDLSVQTAMALLFVYLWQRFGNSFNFYFFACVCSYFVLIALIDLRYRLIPNILIFPAALMLLIGGLIFLHIDLITTLMGGFVGIALFAAVAWLTPQGLGGGDIKLAALIGLFFGFPNVLWALLIGVLLGGIGVISLVAAQRGGRQTQIPYAPFLCLGAMIALFYNPFVNLK